MNRVSNFLAKLMPVAIPLRRLIPTFGTLVVGTALSFGMFAEIWKEESKTRRLTFERLADGRVAAVRKSVGSALDALHALEGLFFASEIVTRREFKQFVGHLPTSEGVAQTFEWIPRVPQAEREKYERAARAEGFAGFRFTERGPGGEMARAGSRAEYFPVYYVEPLKGNRAAVGFDLGSEPTRLAALRKARDSGDLVVSARITLVQETLSQFGFLVFLPVYRGAVIPVTTTERAKTLTGFVLGVFRVGNIVRQSLPEGGAAGPASEIFIFDRSAPPGNQLLYPKGAPAESKGDLKLAGSFSQTIRVGDRAWEVVIVPAAGSLDPLWEPWAALVAGLLFTVTLSGYLFFGLIHSIRLSDSEQRFRDFAESSADWLWEMDEGLRFTYLSSNVERILGVKPEWHYGKTRQDLLGSDSDTETWHAHLKTLREHKPFKEFRYHRTGEGVDPKWISTSGTPFFDAQGKFLGFRGAASDITQKMEAEVELTRARDDLTRLIDTANAPIFGVDVSGNVNEWNRKVAEITGYDKEEVLGRNLVETLIPEGFRQAVNEIISQGLRGEPVENYESPILTKGGQTVEILLSSTPRVDDEGKIVGVLGVGQDISERKRAEQALRESEEQIRLLLDSTAEGIFGVDRNGTCTFVNLACVRILGYQNQEDLLGKNMHELTHHTKVDGTPYPKIECPVGQGIRTGSAINRSDEVFWLADNNSFPVEYFSYPIRKEDEVVGAVVTFFDITKRKQAEEEQTKLRSAMELSDKMASLGQLAAGVAHEINNPIGFVNSNLKTAQEYMEGVGRLLELQNELERELDADGGGAKEVLQRIKALKKEIDLDFIMEDHPKLLADSVEGTGRVIEIVRNMRSFAYVDQGKMEHSDLNQGIESTLKLVANELKYKATVKKKLGAIHKIECYPQQLNQVFLNLLVNAAQAIKNRGEIVISTEMENNHVVVKIKDDGQGIPPEQLSHIFEPFYTTKKIGEGTGLGLSVSYSIIQKHHGTMEVKSEIGKGTEFTIRLPVSAGESEARGKK